MEWRGVGQGSPVGSPSSVWSGSSGSLRNTCEKLRQMYEDCLPGPDGVCQDSEVKRLTRLHLIQTGAEWHHVLHDGVFEIVANSLQGKRDQAGALKLLIRAFELLELAAVNLAVFPWRKEFNMIKKFSGAYIHYLKPALCSDDLVIIFKRMGYRVKDGFYLELGESEPRESVKRAFEFFSARLECEILLEIVEKIEHYIPSVHDLIQERILMESIDKCVSELRVRKYTRTDSQKETRFGRGESTEEFENLYTDIKLNGNETVPPSHREDSRNTNRQNVTSTRPSGSVFYNAFYAKKGNEINFAGSAARNHLGHESPEASFKDRLHFDSVHSNQSTVANVNAEGVLNRSQYLGDEIYQVNDHIDNIKYAPYNCEMYGTHEDVLCEPVTRSSQDRSFRSIPEESDYSRKPEFPAHDSRQPLAIHTTKVDESCKFCGNPSVYFQCECSIFVCNSCGYRNRMECEICEQSLKKLQNSQTLLEFHPH